MLCGLNHVTSDTETYIYFNSSYLYLGLNWFCRWVGGIKEEKRGHQQRLERDFNTKRKEIWHVIQNTTGDRGHVTRYDKHILWSLQKIYSCKIYSDSKRATAASIHSWCEKNPVGSCNMKWATKPDNIPDQSASKCYYWPFYHKTLARYCSHFFNTATIAPCAKNVCSVQSK